MWTRSRTIMVAVAAVALAALVAGALLTLRGGRAAMTSAGPSPARSARQLRSPFTGEPVPALNRVLAVRGEHRIGHGAGAA